MAEGQIAEELHAGGILVADGFQQSLVVEAETLFVERVGRKVHRRCVLDEKEINV